MSALPMIEITYKEIDSSALLRAAESNLAGATVLFLGTTREMTGGRQTQSLVYEAYEAMARQKMVELADEARRRCGHERSRAAVHVRMSTCGPRCEETDLSGLLGSASGLRLLRGWSLLVYRLKDLLTQSTEILVRSAHR